MSSFPSRTVSSSFGQSFSGLGSSQWTERDDGDDDRDDDSSSTSTSHSRSPQSTHSQSSHDRDSQHDSSQVASSKSNAGAIAGGVIAGIVVLAVLVFFLWRRRSSRNRPKVKIEIDPMSALNGEAYARGTAARKDEEQSLIHERSSSVNVDLNPRPSQPQFWRVHNVNDTDNMSLHDAPISRSTPGVERKSVVSGITKTHPRENTISSINLLPIPEKDYQNYNGTATASSSKAGLKSSQTFVSSTKYVSDKDTIKRSSTMNDSPGPSAWKEKQSLNQMDDGSTFTGNSESQTSMRRFSEPGANDLALAAREEVSELRRRVELLKQENAELTRRDSRGDSFERLPAYNE
ncbi:hypothetical protein J3R30DRAFT_3400956 [Lentinula aciculospora]|uniref:Uncharacterized protein n=1 Tax=Lentinula aciculospora TaxID=153920 RepID=A0A9W9AQT3_9AGAR|nr:hypothetical protein J3R30DRAFT_3400956 [Lentinula aciculospora]